MLAYPLRTCGPGRLVCHLFGYPGPGPLVLCIYIINCKFVTALKWFDAQGSVSDYEGGRDLDSLVNLCVHLVVSLFDIPHTWFFPASRRSQASSQTSNPLPLPRRSSL